MFALAASAIGYRTILLGSDMPLEELPAAVKKVGCDAIILSGVLKPDPEVISLALPKLSESTDVPVFLGGQTSIKEHDAIKKLNIVSLGTDMKTGLGRLQDVVPVGKSSD